MEGNERSLPSLTVDSRSPLKRRRFLQAPTQHHKHTPEAILSLWVRENTTPQLCYLCQSKPLYHVRAVSVPKVLTHTMAHLFTSTINYQGARERSSQWRHCILPRVESISTSRGEDSRGHDGKNNC